MKFIHLYVVPIIFSLLISSNVKKDNKVKPLAIKNNNKSNVVLSNMDKDLNKKIDSIFIKYQKQIDALIIERDKTISKIKEEHNRNKINFINGDQRIKKDKPIIKTKK